MTDQIDSDAFRNLAAGLSASSNTSTASNPFQMYSFNVVTVRIRGVKAICPVCNRPIYITTSPFISQNELDKAYFFHSDKYGCNPTELSLEYHYETVTGT